MLELAASVIIGIVSSYMTTRITLAVQHVEIKYLRRDVDNMHDRIASIERVI